MCDNHRQTHSGCFSLENLKLNYPGPQHAEGAIFFCFGASKGPSPSLRCTRFSPVYNSIRFLDVTIVLLLLGSQGELPGNHVFPKIKRRSHPEDLKSTRRGCITFWQTTVSPYRVPQCIYDEWICSLHNVFWRHKHWNSFCLIVNISILWVWYYIITFILTKWMKMSVADVSFYQPEN